MTQLAGSMAITTSAHGLARAIKTSSPPSPPPAAATRAGGGGRKPPGTVALGSGGEAWGGWWPEGEFIKAIEFAVRLGVSRASLYRAKAAGLLPRETRLGARSVRWYGPEIDSWMRCGCPPQDRWEQMREHFGFGPRGGR